MNDAERLAELANLPAIERVYKTHLQEFERMTLAAGVRGCPVDIMKKNFFEMQFAGAGQKADDIRVNEMYQMQHDLIQKFKDNGFKVTEDKPSNIITLDKAAADPREQQKKEFEKRFLETKFIVEW